MVFNTKLRFIVTSDIHYKIDEDLSCERFEKGMELAYKYALKSEYKSIDAFFAVGDFANSGREDEMLRFKASIDKCIAPETKTVLMLASHEFHSAGQQNAERLLKEIFGQNPDNYFELKGCPFICISTEDGCRIKEAKQKWLSECLSDAAAGGRERPFFVFQHPHLTDTVYGSINWGDDDIIAILTDYPQVIDFSGHSHAPINDPRSIHQKYFTSLGTGSLLYFELDEFVFMYGTVPPDCKECAQFYIVEVSEENAVRIIPYDILSEKPFFDSYIINTPWEPDSFEYTVDKRALSEPAPYFADDFDCKYSYDGNKLIIDFPQARTDGYRVNSYSIVIRDNEKRILRQKKISSSYYINNMPVRLKAEIELSAAEGEYYLELTANGFWYAKSDKIVKKIVI